MNVYADLAVFLRVVHPAGLGVWLDSIAPVGLRGAVGIDFGRSRGVHPFVEYGPMFYFGEARLMKAAVLASQGEKDGPGGCFAADQVVITSPPGPAAIQGLDVVPVALTVPLGGGQNLDGGTLG